MKRRFLLLVMVIITVLTGVQSAAAQDDSPPCSLPPCVYVNPERQPDGNEDGERASPYNELNEGKARAQAMSGGGWVYYRNPDTDVWEKTFVPEAVPTNLGDPLPSMALYLLLGILALTLILVGRRLQRRARQA